MSQSPYYYRPEQSSAAAPTQADRMRQHYIYEQTRRAQTKTLRKISCAFGAAILAYLVVQTVASTVILARPSFATLYRESPVFQYAFNVIFVSVLSVAAPFGLVALVCKKQYRRSVVPSCPIRPGRAALWVGFGMGSCILANIVVNGMITVLKEAFNVNLTQSESLSPDSVFACILEVIAIAVIPAVCEEFAMRCCALQLLRNYGSGFAVFAVSVVFGLLHGNVIQFVFAFLIGLVLAYITVKTDSIVPAILIHLLNNGMSAVQDIAAYAAGKRATENLLVVMFLFWIAVGVVCGILLLVKREFKKLQRDGSCVLTFGQKLHAFLFPGMLLPFGILLLITATTISIG